MKINQSLSSVIKPRFKLPGFSIVPILVVLLFAYASFFSIYGLSKHAAFQTTGYDLGIWDQKLWNILHGRPFVETTQREVEIGLGDHVDLIALVLVPIYALYPGPQTLIVLQVFLVTLGAIPIYWLAKDKFHSQFAGIIFGIVYLLFPALESSISFDFHGITIAAPILAYAIWALYQKHNKIFFISVVLAMACQEDVSLFTLMMGFYILVFRKDWRMGGTVFVCSALWFWAANFMIKPAFSLTGNIMHFARYTIFGNTPGQVIVTILSKPSFVLEQIFAGEKKYYWIRLTMPTAFMALLDPITLLMALPSILLNTMSSYPPTYQLDKFHSSAAIVPFVVVAGINGVHKMLRFGMAHLKYVSLGFLQNMLMLMVLIVTIIYQTELGYTPIGTRFFYWPSETEHVINTKTMLAMIPSQAAVAAQNNLVPHLSTRQWIYILPKISHRGKQAEYIAFDMRGDLAPYTYIEDYCKQIDDLLVNQQYGLVFANDGLLLFEQNMPDRVSIAMNNVCQ